MLFLPFVLHAGLGLLLFTSRLRRSESGTRALKERLKPTISAALIPMYIDAFYGGAISKSLSRGATYLSRRSAASLAAAQLYASGLIPRRPFQPGDLVIYDPRFTDIIIYVDHCTNPEYDKYWDEVIIEEEPWVWDIPFYFDTNHVRQSAYIDPEDATYSFAQGLSEVPPFPTEEPASQPTRPSRSSKSSRKDTSPRRSSSSKKEHVGRTAKIRKAPKVQKAPKSLRDKLRSRLARIPRGTRRCAALMGGLVLYPVVHFVRIWLLAFIHRHIKPFVVYATTFTAVRVFAMAVERLHINIDPTFAIYTVLFELVL
ncbi:hypothetical protein PAXINDRAFT_21686 [Paxillus involutus ATCC 200175]|uniref:Uncharacterized protein n=1 Tax=Paxillus involutus ATCC 200175 TaxID=664439 RepID=A0A0C9T9Z3_PAXIN|nr:hypothetical protein PAXINDRAFT_21686 [Paxillus involutus ATCC 200175]